MAARHVGSSQPSLCLFFRCAGSGTFAHYNVAASRDLVGSRVSITTCFISFLAVPALVVFGKDSVPMAGQIAVMGTALAGTGGSTLLLNLCVSPYVFRMAEVRVVGWSVHANVARGRRYIPSRTMSTCLSLPLLEAKNQSNNGCSALPYPIKRANFVYSSSVGEGAVTFSRHRCTL